MRISIITATYNSTTTIADCLSSVNEQTYDDIEHIIVDGASTDKTLEIIKSIPNRVKQIISEPDNGIYDAMNKGIKLATGDIVGILNSDDIFADKHSLKSIIQAFSKNNTDGVYGDLVLVNKNNTSKIIRRWKSQKFQSELLNRGWMPAHPTLFLKKEVYERHGLFDLSFKISADYDFMIRILKDNDLKFVYIPILITKMRMGGASNNSLRKLYFKTKEDYKVLKKNNISNPLQALVLKKLNKVIQYL